MVEVWKFEVFAGSSGQYNWRLFADNGQNVASSGEPFASKSNADRAADGFKAGAASANYEVYESSASNWRWRAKAGNGETIAGNGDNFASKQNAERAADNVKANAGKADGP